MEVRADAATGDELDALDFHLFDAAIDLPLFEFEVGNPIHQQAPDAIRSLIERARVARAPQLVCACHTRRSRSHYCDAFARLARIWLRRHPALGPSVIDD